MKTALVLASIALTACAGSLPAPPTGPHVGEEAVIVPYPPPPGRVELIPDPPPGLKGAVWIDGEWQWRRGRWVWQGGSWQPPAPKNYYWAPSATLPLADGTHAYFPGVWKVRTAAAAKD